MTRGWIYGIVGLAIGIAACGGGGGGGGSSPTAPSPPPPSGVGATITLTANGVSTQTVRIEVGQQVMFVNNGGRGVAVTSDPHPTHENCPPLNEVGFVMPGQSRAATFTQRGTCSFHDHDNPDDMRFRGNILVGVAEPGPSPDYRTAH